MTDQRRKQSAAAEEASRSHDVVPVPAERGRAELDGARATVPAGQLSGLSPPCCVRRSASGSLRMPLRLTRPSPRGDQRDKAGCRPDRHPLTRDSPPPSIAQGEEGAAALGVGAAVALTSSPRLRVILAGPLGALAAGLVAASTLGLLVVGYALAAAVWWGRQILRLGATGALRPPARRG